MRVRTAHNHVDEIDPRTRQRFIEDVKSFLLNFGFDGLDLYWYSPVYWRDGSVLHHEDKDNFQLLMNELKVKYEFVSRLRTGQTQDLNLWAETSGDIQQTYEMANMSYNISFSKCSAILCGHQPAVDL